MDDIASEIDAERTGLENRYDEACTSAGFALGDAFATETDGHDSMASDLTVTVMACERRLAALSRQLEILADARAAIGILDPGSRSSA